MKQYSLDYLESLPTISIGQADDLKLDLGNMRVWLARTTVEDGEPFNNKVTVEKLSNNGRWETIEEYEAL